ncbi:armadillo-type protein [Dipodascopsis uninucleata]
MGSGLPHDTQDRSSRLIKSFVSPLSSSKAKEKLGSPSKLDARLLAKSSQPLVCNIRVGKPDSPHTKLFHDDDDVFEGNKVIFPDDPSEKLLKNGNIDDAFEELLNCRGIAHHLRPELRELDINVKASLITNDMCPSPVIQEDHKVISSDQHITFLPSPPRPPQKTRKRIFKKHRSSLVVINLITTPEEFVSYLKSMPSHDLDLNQIRQLKRLLRSERMSWTENFLKLDGIDALRTCLISVIDLKWREAKDDDMLAELLSCFKALSTSDLGLDHITTISSLLFSKLIDLLFSDKQPSYFTTRSLIIHILCSHIRLARPGDRATRAKTVLEYLEDSQKARDRLGPNFIEISHPPRLFKKWFTECHNVVRDVFWVFIHKTYNIRVHPFDAADIFDKPKPVIVTKSYIGAVESEALEYLALHLELMNIILISIPSRSQRNAIRQQLRDCRFESLVANYLRTATTSYTKSLQRNLELLLSAANSDGWDIQYMRTGTISVRRIQSSAPLVITNMTTDDFSADDFTLPDGDFGLSEHSIHWQENQFETAN